MTKPIISRHVHSRIEPLSSMRLKTIFRPHSAPRVQFSCDKEGRGKITFPFRNEEELEKLIALFDTIKTKA